MAIKYSMVLDSDIERGIKELLDLRLSLEISLNDPGIGVFHRKPGLKMMIDGIKYLVSNLQKFQAEWRSEINE